MIRFCAFLLVTALLFLTFHSHTPESSLPKDLYYPNRSDYLQIQAYLRKKDRPLISYLNDYEHRVRKFKLIGKKINKSPESGRICVNSPEDARENCILLYASYNKNYPQALKRLIDHIATSDFKGHILYQIGGWPNVEAGDLSFVDVPYAFKVAFFRKAQRLGYKRALWLDTAVFPLHSTNQQFSWIEEKGFLAVGNTHMVGPFFNEKAAEAMGIEFEKSFAIPSVSAGIFGLDFSSEKACRLLQLWYEAAAGKVAFFSARPEQNALSILLDQLEMRRWIPYDKVAENRAEIREDSLYVLDRGFAHAQKSVR